MNRIQEHILVFDSGLGGLSVLRELIKVLPQERFYYFGDSVHAPYGSKSTGQVRDLTLAAVKKHMPLGLKAVVIACNTATAAAIETLRETYPDCIIIGVEPALKLAADRNPGSKILVMATEVTLREARFAALLHRFEAENEIISLPCPGLVEYIEAGKWKDPALKAYLSSLLSPHLSPKPQSIVLGCTHFPFLKPLIRELVGPDVEILDGSHGTAMHTLHCLEEKGLLSPGPGSVEISNSSNDPELLRRSQALLNLPEL